MALFQKPKFATVKAKTVKEQPNDGKWIRSKGNGEFIKLEDLVGNDWVCPKSGYYYPLPAPERIALLTENFKEIDGDLISKDVLGFEGYSATLEDKKQKTGLKDAVVTGFGKIDGQEVGLAVMDFRFMGASMGSIVGEKITRVIEAATKKGVPVIITTASGGARMQEGSLSLMQMAKTSGALARHSNAGLPFICLLTNPTYGGVTASFASLGDVIIAEPGAMIGFAGARVIETTIKAELPEGFQTAEFLEEHGLVDRIIAREDLKKELSTIISYLMFSKNSKKKA